MGDSGSQILGFSAAVLAVVLTQDTSTALSSALPLLLLGIPIIDTLMVMTGRVLAGRSPFSADRSHIHHRLLARGFDHHEAVVAIYLLQATLFLTAWFLRYETDVTIVGVFASFSCGTIALLQAAERFDWRWRVAPAGPHQTVSPLAGAIAWLRRPEHVPMWTLAIITLIVGVFFFWAAASAPVASVDIRIMAALLAAAMISVLAVQWREPEAGWAARTILYVAAVIAAYFIHETNAHEFWPFVQWAVFAILVLAIVLRLRLANDRRFRITSLDVLVIFAALIVPNLPGSIVTAAGLGESIARLIAVMYAIESVMGAGARWWRAPCLAALLFLVICAVRGAI
jgi:UDP-GlcNAc:undecaprenyl-phosphate GlcNAc-1-phosphate transferase